MELAIYIICAALGISIGFLLGRNRKKESELEAQVKILRTQCADLADTISEVSELLMEVSEEERPRLKMARSSILTFMP